MSRLQTSKDDMQWELLEVCGLQRLLSFIEVGWSLELKAGEYYLIFNQVFNNLSIFLFNAIQFSQKRFIVRHSVLERIWIKGFYLSQWLLQGERWPLRSQNHDALKSSTVGPTNKFFFQSFFQTKKFFFQEQKKFFQGTTFIQFFMYCKAKKNSEWSENFWKFLIFQNH